MKKLKNIFLNTGFLIRGIFLLFLLILYIISYIIGMSCFAFWYRIFNKEKYYLLLHDIDKI
jgi:hypothetical protein